MRLFIAIEIPEEIRNGLAGVQGRLKHAGIEASWPRPEGIHLTLKFLGEVPEPVIPAIMEGLRRSGEGVKPFRIEVAGVGTFPNAKNARVVWAGISGDRGTLDRLQAAIEDAMARAGFERDERAFSPHLTIGRVKSIRSRDRWLKALEEIGDLGLPGFDVASVRLMRSELKPTGAVYREVGRVELE